jgi:hypothetical protein
MSSHVKVHVQLAVVMIHVIRVRTITINLEQLAIITKMYMPNLLSIQESAQKVGLITIIQTNKTLPILSYS